MLAAFRYWADVVKCQLPSRTAGGARFAVLLAVFGNRCCRNVATPARHSSASPAPCRIADFAEASMVPFAPLAHCLFVAALICEIPSASPSSCFFIVTPRSALSFVFISRADEALPIRNKTFRDVAVAARLPSKVPLKPSRASIRSPARARRESACPVGGAL